MGVVVRTGVQGRGVSFIDWTCHKGLATHANAGSLTACNGFWARGISHLVHSWIIGKGRRQPLVFGSCKGRGRSKTTESNTSKFQDFRVLFIKELGLDQVPHLADTIFAVLATER